MKNKPSRPSFLIYPKVLDKKKALAALAVKASVHYGLFVFFVYSIFFSISSFSADALSSYSGYSSKA